MAITTYSALITDPNSLKIFLVEVEPSEEITTWTQYSGSIYQSTIGLTDLTIDVIGIDEDGSALTEVTALADIAAGKWFYTSTIVYVQPSSGTIFSKTIVGDYKMYFTNEIAKGDGSEIIFNNKFYEPVIDSIPDIRQSKKDFFWGISIISEGTISINNDGRFDDIFEQYAWNNKPITVLAGGEDLPYSEYNKMFKGKINDKSLDMEMFDISFVDDKEEWETSIPLNSYNTTAYPNLDTEDSGKPVPYAWGDINKMPVVNITRGLGTATSIHTFKCVDTAINSITSIDQVYVNNLAVDHHSADLAAATFKLSSSIYTPGDEVTVDFEGYKSGSLIENPMSIVKIISNDIIGVTYNSDNFDTATFEVAVTDADEYPVGLALIDRESAIDVVGSLMKSCLGTFFNNNDGLYSAVIWDTDIPTSPDTVDDIDIHAGSLSAVSVLEDIRSKVLVGYAKIWSTNSYRYVENESDTTEDVYGIKKTRTIRTLLSTEAGAQKYNDRILLMLEGSRIRVTFKTNLQLSQKNIGDRISITFKRYNGADNIAWLDQKNIEIYEIRKDFSKGEIRISADDLKGIGTSIGKWMSATVNFPASVGGGSGDAWDSSWSDAKASYAANNWGYWCDADGFADSTDGRSKDVSRWW